MTKLVAVVGPTATGKSALGLALAEQFNGEIVSCDSTAVYRGLDIGTDKLLPAERLGIPHHLIDVAEPTEVYSAARYGADAALAIAQIQSRGRVPIVVGGTGFYFRALVRGLFPGPARDEMLRARLERVADRRDVTCLHRWLSYVDPPSALRIQPRDRKRLIRALEVYLLTGRPLTDHFAATKSPLGACEVLMLGLHVPRPVLLDRVTRRVDEQFERGVVDEVQSMLAAGVPLSAQAFSGLVYRQVIELLQGLRDERETRALVVRENMRYAKRQMVWFKRESNVHWFDGTAADLVPQAIRRVEPFLAGFLYTPSAHADS